MEYEIELKLLTNEKAGEIIEKKLLPQLNAKVIQDTLKLTNHYFDTPNATLRQHKIGLRIRGNNKTFEQTLKTAGHSIGGLHQRPEYNVQLDEKKKHNVNVPDLRLFPLSAWPTTIDVDDLQHKITTLFTTHFERKIYLLEFSDGDIVELVWDLGEVRSGDKSVPICEIELELKKGSTRALFDIAKRVVSLLPTSIGMHSKAALGYKLLEDFPDKEREHYQYFQHHQHHQPDNIKAEAEGFAGLLTTLLHDFQILSAEIRRQYSETLATNIKQVLLGLVDNVGRFSQHFPYSSFDNIQIQLKTLVNEWSLVVEHNNESAANSLLVCTQTTQLQLDIVQCLVERSWVSKV